MEALILGNGPSLLEKFKPSMYSHPNIYGCNRIFLHPDFSTFSRNLILFLSDTSFASKYDQIKHYISCAKHTYAPYDYDWPPVSNTTFYQIERSSPYFKNSAASNLASYPTVKESCSVLFTVVLPHVVNTSRFATYRLLGFDGIYDKGSPYFYNSSINQDFRWTDNQSTEWSQDFHSEMVSVSAIIPGSLN